MRVAKLVGLVLLLVSSVTVIAAEEQPVPQLPIKDFSKATAHPVERIVDGDTVVMNMFGASVKVRLIGVDTPETVHPQKPVQAYGKEASLFLTTLLAGEKVYVESKPDEKKDKYGRSLFYLWRAPDGLFINAEIIRQGYGQAYKQFPHPHMEAFRYYEKQARENERGLWARVGEPQPDIGQLEMRIRQLEAENKLLKSQLQRARSRAAIASEKRTAPTVETPIDAPTERVKPRSTRRRRDREDRVGTEDSVTVYGTRTGSKYHRGSCRYLRKSQIPMSLKDAKRRYTPCSVCRPPS